MSSLVRSIGAVVAGLVVCVVVIVSVEGVSSTIYPLPAGVDPMNPEAMKAHMAQLPLGAFLLVLAGWGLGGFAGAWTAARVDAGRRPTRGYVVGALLLVLAVANMLLLPHPVWFWVAGVIVVPAFSYAGARLGSAPPASGASTRPAG